MAVRSDHPPGESLLLSEPMLDGLAAMNLPARRRREGSAGEPPHQSSEHPWIDALARPDRPPLVEAMAVYFNPDSSPEEVMAFQAMAGVLTPAKCPSELFLLTKERPASLCCKLQRELEIESP